MGWLKTYLVNTFLQNIPLLAITETNQSENVHGETLIHGCYVVRFMWAVVHGVLFKGHHKNLLFTNTGQLFPTAVDTYNYWYIFTVKVHITAATPNIPKTV